MTRRAFLTAAFVLLVVMGLFPILTMLAGSFAAEGRISLEAYRGLLSSGREWTLLGHSVILALSVSLLTTVVGVPLGILLGKTDLPFRRLFMVLFSVPLLIPTYITAVGWTDFLGPNGLFESLAGSVAARAAYRQLVGLPGCVFVLFSTFLPIVVLLTITSLKSLNPRWEEAGRLVDGWTGTLRRITVPLIVPGISLGTILVFLLALGEFGVPNFLRYDVFTAESFLQFSAFYDFRAATASVVPLAVITGLVVLGEWLFLRERLHQVQPISERTAGPPISLGTLRPVWLSLVGLLCVVIVLLPLIVLVVRSSSFATYTAAFRVASDSLQRSLMYAAVGASGLVVIGFFLGYLIQRQSMPFWRAADALLIFLFALPGTVIGIGLVSLWNRSWTNFVYGTAAIIILGYLAKYAALTSRITASVLMLIPKSMEEAGQAAGIPWLRRIGSIVMPLAKKGILAGWIVGYIFCLRDLETTMIIYPAGHETLPVRITTLMANSPAELIAALCVVMVVTTVLPPALLWTLFSLPLRTRRS